MGIDLNFSNSVAVMTINRPDALNALNLAQITAIEAAVDRVSNSDARALVVLGAGGARARVRDKLSYSRGP